MACITCPFSYNEESELAQNYGCLPSAYDIIKMKETTGNNWTCHSADVVCRGLVECIDENNLTLDVTKGQLIKWISAHGVNLNAEGTYD